MDKNLTPGIVPAGDFIMEEEEIADTFREGNIIAMYSLPIDPANPELRNIVIYDDSCDEVRVVGTSWTTHEMFDAAIATLRKEGYCWQSFEFFDIPGEAFPLCIKTSYISPKVSDKINPYHWIAYRPE